MISNIGFVLLALTASALASDLGYGHGFFPWSGGWHASPYYGYTNGHGLNYGHGHDDVDAYGKHYGHEFAHDDNDRREQATGFAKGAKSDWANYQYGGEGSRAEGDAFAKSYGNHFGDGHDAGHAYGHGGDYLDGHGAAFGHDSGYGHAPHYAAHYPW